MEGYPQFGKAFRWGVATAAYQIEGAHDVDGRAPSIWDTFCHDGEDRVVDGDTGDVACDHYHRYGEDVALMAGLGVNSYRFSLAWPRIQPGGRGPANPAGIAFYDRLVDSLLDNGISPAATLFHWDLPQELQDAGGWSNRETAYRFAEYADLISKALGDRIGLWLTLNEPAIHTTIGHVWGMHAPGQRLWDDPFPVAHHQLLGHGLAVAALRANTCSPIGIANNYGQGWAVGVDGERGSATDEDRAACAVYDAFHNYLYTDPLLFGRYPDGLTGIGGAQQLAQESSDGLVRPGDMGIIGAPIDALGVNFYNPVGVGAPSWPGPLPWDARMIAGRPLTYFGWPVVPEGLTEVLVGLRERYGVALPPIHVTESGCTYDDRQESDGSIVDEERIDYLRTHIAAVAAAAAQGVTVHGYHVWTLMDNFEWAEGYSKRFGLVYVNFADQRRTPKASYAWYRDLIAASRS